MTVLAASAKIAGDLHIRNDHDGCNLHDVPSPNGPASKNTSAVQVGGAKALHTGRRMSYAAEELRRRIARPRSGRRRLAIWAATAAAASLAPQALGRVQGEREAADVERARRRNHPVGDRCCRPTAGNDKLLAGGYTCSTRHEHEPAGSATSEVSLTLLHLDLRLLQLRGLLDKPNEIRSRAGARGIRVDHAPTPRKDCLPPLRCRILRPRQALPVDRRC
mmetsp:Transcript_158316/g.507749  ORF Transcript_158316/g.507749 Transcript_158316/m.507749 type:complete len:220 (-) Transcript_158316:290-949(-)